MRRSKPDSSDVSFPDSTTQQDIYSTITTELVEAVLQVRNSFVLGYGGTGSGKMYTMLDAEFSDDDFGLYPSQDPNSGVRIEEIMDEEKPSNENENYNRQIVVKSAIAVPIRESEDDDGFPKSLSSGSNTEERDIVARIEDESTDYVLPNRTLVKIAKQMPLTTSSLCRVLESKHSYIEWKFYSVVSIIRRSIQNAAAFEDTVKYLKQRCVEILNEQNTLTTEGSELLPAQVLENAEEVGKMVFKQNKSQDIGISDARVATNTSSLALDEVIVQAPKKPSGALGALVGGSEKRKFDTDKREQEESKLMQIKSTVTLQFHSFLPKNEETQADAKESNASEIPTSINIPGATGSSLEDIIILDYDSDMEELAKVESNDQLKEQEEDNDGSLNSHVGSIEDHTHDHLTKAAEENELESQTKFNRLKCQPAEMHEENDILLSLYEEAMQERDELKRIIVSGQPKIEDDKGDFTCPEKHVEIDKGLCVMFGEVSISLDNEFGPKARGPAPPYVQEDQNDIDLEQTQLYEIDVREYSVSSQMNGYSDPNEAELKEPRRIGVDSCTFYHHLGSWRAISCRARGFGSLEQF